ncbi:MAG: redoxin domain-containing protein [Chloroflexi bacterium]|nr:redoxin domain-containing protein [Chloroflexota bacterium]
MQQLGELQGLVGAMRQQAEVYVINSDAPADSRRLKQITRIEAPVLLDPALTAARQYDMLPKPAQPMGGMTGVAQMGFVIVDAGGAIRIQRVDIQFGNHAGQMLDILDRLRQATQEGPRRETAVYDGGWYDGRL